MLKWRTKCKNGKMELFPTARPPAYMYEFVYDDIPYIHISHSLSVHLHQIAIPVGSFFVNRWGP